jgi:50S ribosomal subunit-associated GTPase HflX
LERQRGGIGVRGGPGETQMELDRRMLATKAKRLATGDPRLSIEERYGSQADYVSAVTKASDDLVKNRYLLAEDGEKFKAAAAKINIFAQ